MESLETNFLEREVGDGKLKGLVSVTINLRLLRSRVVL